MRIAEMDIRPVVALQGATSEIVQPLLAAIAERLAMRGLRVVGVVESPPRGPQPCKAMELRSLDDGRLFPISQDLGPGSTACNLSPEGLALACAAVQNAIARGADVAVLSKFGKLEAAGEGLVDAFGTAIAHGLPVITSVSPAMMSEWQAFAGDLAACVSVEAPQVGDQNWQQAWLERSLGSWVDAWVKDAEARAGLARGPKARITA
jgi:nucleoside-triphosphatase THEP1